MQQVFGHVETDASRPDQRHLAAHGALVAQHIQVPHHLGMVDAVKLRAARFDTGGDDDLVEGHLAKHRGVDAAIQSQVDRVHLDHSTVIAQGLVELFLAWNASGKVELAADIITRLIQRDRVPPTRRHGGIGQTCRSCADHGDTARLIDLRIAQ